MTALAAERDTKQMGCSPAPGLLNYPVNGGAKLYAGALACVDAQGNLVAGATATTLKAVGRVRKTVDNTAGADGDERADIDLGIFRYENSAAADLIDAGDLFADCYVVDDQTVALTDGSSTRSLAGKIIDVDASGVWVAVGVGVWT